MIWSAIHNDKFGGNLHYYFFNILTKTLDKNQPYINEDEDEKIYEKANKGKFRCFGASCAFAYYDLADLNFPVLFYWSHIIYAC